MKLIRANLTFASILFFSCAGLWAAVPAASPEPAPGITAEFVSPEKFTDFRDEVMETTKAREHLMTQVREHLATLAKHVPAGRRLELRFTDIDLAGDYEPWRGPDFDDIRIMKDIYPPRMKFEFRLLDAKSGAVVREGSERISDMSYLMSAGLLPNHDPLRYDKNLLTDWVRRELRADPAK